MRSLEAIRDGSTNTSPSPKPSLDEIRDAVPTGDNVPDESWLPDLGKAAKNLPGSFVQGLDDMKDAAVFLASANEKYDHAGGGLRFLIDQLVTEMRYEDPEEKAAYEKVQAAAKAAGGHAVADARKDPAYMAALAEAKAVSDRVMKEKRSFLHSIGDQIFEKWSTWGRFKTELENDPAGIIGDIAAFLAPPLRGVQAPGMAGKAMRGAGKVLDTLDTGNIAGTVGEALPKIAEGASAGAKAISKGARDISVGRPKIDEGMKDIAISTGVEGVDIPLAVVSENPRIIRREADLAEMGSNTARVAEDAQAAAEASKRAAIPKGANAKLQEKWNRIEGKISGKDLTASEQIAAWDADPDVFYRITNRDRVGRMDSVEDMQSAEVFEEAEEAVLQSGQFSQSDIDSYLKSYSRYDPTSSQARDYPDPPEVQAVWDAVNAELAKMGFRRDPSNGAIYYSEGVNAVKSFKEIQEYYPRVARYS